MKGRHSRARKTWRAMNLNEKYEPLFRPPDTRYVLVKGGRGSGKSYAVSTANLVETYNDNLKILYSRYTMASAEISIIPEYIDKMEELGRSADFKTRSADITNIISGGQILFRGLKTSSGNQIAKLKSIQGVKRWVLDEAQELDSEDTFNTIDFSVRTMKAPNVITMVFNPTDIHSWIYKRFYKGVPEGFNGVIDDVRYISTTYLDNRDNLSQSLIDRAEKMRLADEKRWRNIWLGEWAEMTEGVIYPGWKEISFSHFPVGLSHFYGVDWGYSNDPTAVVCCSYDPLSKAIYVRQVCYERGLLAGHVARIIREDMRDFGIEADAEIYCDPARPEHIGELRMNDLNAIGADNRNKAGRIMYLRYFSVLFTGADIERERSTYSYRKDKSNEGHYLNEPEDGNDHLMDAINYAAVTHLRRENETNLAGES